MKWAQARSEVRKVMACSRYLREGVDDLKSAGTEGEGVGLITIVTRFSICNGDARCGMCKPASEMKNSLAGRTWRARLNLLERAVGVEDDTVEDYVLQLHSA